LLRASFIQIYERRVDVLSERRESGPVKAFDELEPDERHPGKFKIKSAKPTWAGLDMRAARVFLADSGRSAFLAEYQHEFDVDRSEYVLPNWRDEVHVITRSEFTARYGVREIPVRWGTHILHDWARTKSQYHANVAGFLSVAAQNAKLPGLTFLHECMSFEAGTEADDVALRILKALSPTVTVGAISYSWDELQRAALSREHLERFFTSATRLMDARRDVLAGVFPEPVRNLLDRRRVLSLRMSHEAKAARDVYRRVYGLSFVGVNPGADGGVELLNHLTYVDRTRPHQFKEDELLPDGTYRLGASSFFLLVEDDRAAAPKGSSSVLLHDSDLARYQLRRWRNVPEKISATGAVERGPMKMDDDFGNMLMMRYHDGLPQAAPLSYGEQLETLSPVLKEINDKVAQQGGVSLTEEMSFYLARSHAKKVLCRSGGIRSFDEDDQVIEHGGDY
jgi:hypothetical protein